MQRTTVSRPASRGAEDRTTIFSKTASPVKIPTAGSTISRSGAAVLGDMSNTTARVRQQPRTSSQRAIQVQMVEKPTIRQKPQIEGRAALKKVGSAIAEHKAQSDFQGSYFCSAIEQAVLICKDLAFRKDTPEVKQSHLLDCDSTEGRQAVRAQLDSIERLLKIFEVPKADREYRAKFTPSYKSMLAGESYFLDILDSAQEAYPFMWVNGEKYVFSDHVIEKGTALFESLISVTRMMPTVTSMDRVAEFKSQLERFDSLWTVYEVAYVTELIVIEHDARRFIRNLVSASFDSPNAFCEAIGEINAVANTEGQGRKDFDPALLTTARSLKDSAPAVRSICAKIETAYAEMTHYSRTVKLDFVDPQLRNNTDLCKALKDFEDAWNLGKEHLSSQLHLQHLTQFNKLLKDVQARHPQFKAMVESCEAQLFLSLPALAILYDMSSVVERFAPTLAPKLPEIQADVKRCGKRALIELDVLELCASGVPVASAVKSAAVQLMRERAEKWNQFVNVCLQ